MPIEIRNGPEGAPNEGAFEDGQQLTVIGRKLQIGEVIPDVLLRNSATPHIHRGETRPRNLGASYLLYSVNGFATPVCEVEARECQKLVIVGKIPRNITLFGLSNEDSVFLELWSQQNGINFPHHQLLSSKDSDAGFKLGLYIPEYDGQLQRALFGVVAGRLVHTEYIYDQGGPQPDFNAAIDAVRVATYSDSI